MANEDQKTTLHCSFCGKLQHEVKKLIAGPTMFICNECVFLSFEICLEEGAISKKDVLVTVTKYLEDPVSTK